MLENKGLVDANALEAGGRLDRCSFVVRLP